MLQNAWWQADTFAGEFVNIRVKADSTVEVPEVGVVSRTIPPMSGSTELYGVTVRASELADARLGVGVDWGVLSETGVSL
ncbi:hypothetical protein BH11PLA2_BH11PLA2_25400 [soil metagenome]